MADRPVVVTIVSIGAVAFSYFLQYSYLAPFGLQPDQVGIVQVSTLSRLIPVALVSLVLASLVTAILGSILSVLRAIPFGGAIIVGVCVASIALMTTSRTLTQSTSPWVQWLAFLPISGILAVLVYLIGRSWGSQVVGSLLTIVLVLGVLAAIAYSAVAGDAERLRMTGRPGVVLGIIGANVQPVRVSWPDQKTLPRSMVLDRRGYADLTLIADGAGRYALFDCERGRTYLVDHGQVGLELSHRWPTATPRPCH